MKFIKKYSAFIVLLIVGQLFCGLAYAENNGKTAKQKRLEELKNDLQTITYTPKDPKMKKAVIYLLTDMNCTYCHKIHEEIPTLVDLGVEVRVMAMPRQGVGSSSYNTMVSIWCSDDPKASLTKGMEGGRVAPKTCKNPVKLHYTLGKQWGVIGTPTIVFEDGTLRSGYYPAAKLAQEAIKRARTMHIKP